MRATDEHDDLTDGLLAHAVVDPSALLVQQRVQRVRRRRQRLLAALLAFAVFGLVAVVAAQVGFTGTGSTAPAAPKVAVRGEAAGVLLVRPGEAVQRIASAAPVVGASISEQRSTAAWALDSVASVERATTSASADPKQRSSTAVASIERITLSDGRVELQGARLEARAGSADGRATNSLELADTTRLLVDGEPVEITPNKQVVVEGLGTVLINEQAVLANAPTGDAQTGPRTRVVGALAHVRITQDNGQLKAGTELVIGRVDAGVREGKVRPVEHPDPETPPAVPATPLTGGGSFVPQTGALKPGESTLPRRPSAVRSGASAPTLKGSLQGYLFPVLGRHGYSNDWGAPRASTGVPHQGTDIFADEGTPIVAVADGVLDRVGWNAIGGYRFWLFDQYGNSFYHAHLSAYSPLAQDGAYVKRGDVIGFVGDTGDAKGTPPHLHFEIHPLNGAPTNPFPFLNAWKQGVAVAIGLLAGPGDRIAPLSLLGFTDIAANSGLQGSVLDTVPETTPRSVEDEHAPVDTADSLKGAIDGPGTSAAS